VNTTGLLSAKMGKTKATCDQAFDDDWLVLGLGGSAERRSGGTCGKK
jgi:hypothetical protein